MPNDIEDAQFHDITPYDPARGRGEIAKAPTTEEIKQFIEAAAAQVLFFKKVLSIAITRTHSGDWLNQSDKPYLKASGAEKLMSVFRISIGDVVHKKYNYTDELGPYYVYEYRGIATWPGGSLEAVGIASSRDKFFAWDKYKRSFKKVYDVDEQRVAKKAYTNMRTTGITCLLGIRNLTWDQLEQGGVNKGSVESVSYAKKDDNEREYTPPARENAARNQPARGGTADHIVVTPEDRRGQFALQEKIFALGRGDKDNAAAWLRQHTETDVEDAVLNIKMITGEKLKRLTALADEQMKTRV